MKIKTKISFITIFIFFCLQGVKDNLQNFSETKKDYQYFSLFSKVVSLVKSNYVEEIKQKEKFPFAFSSMLSSLDRFSSYLDAEKTRIYNMYQKGLASGCGIYGIKKSNYFYITDIYKDSPADRAGLKPGDYIKAIGGKSVYSLSFWEIYLSLLSDKPRDITMNIVRKKTKAANDIKLRTLRIPTKTNVKKIEGGIFFVELSRFDGEGVKILKNKLLTNETLKLIIDLRKYSGGDFKSFREISTLFFSNRIPLIVKMKDKRENYILGSQKALKYKAVIIINKSTIMYGEFLASIFQSIKKKTGGSVTLVGIDTEGFVSKLRLFGFDDSSSVLMTEGLFFLNRKDLSKTRVKPDIKMDTRDNDKVLTKCVSLINKN